jgi:hypothetical protein
MRYLLLVGLLAGCAKPPPELNPADYEAFCARGCSDRYRECMQKISPLVGDDVLYKCRYVRNECLEKCPREKP